MEIKKGYKQTELGIIPEEWEVKKLGDCFDFLTTNSYSREKMTYEEQEYMNIHYGDIHMKYGATLDIEKMKGKIPYIKAEEILPKKIILVEEGDLLIADASEDYKDIGKSTEVLNIKNSKVLGGLHTLLLRDKNNYFINGYKGYILRNEKISKEVKKIATGISVLGISKTNLSELNIPIPPLKEQEKIAEILSYYDKAIEQQELLIEKEKEFKKGMMQKIFSQEIRFKDDNGNCYMEWKEENLGKITNICTGKKDMEDKKENGVFPFFVRSKTIERIDTYSYEGEAILIPGDGKIGEIFHYINGKFDYHQRVYKISDFNNNIGKYIYYYLKKNFKKHALMYTVKATVDSLRLPIIKKFIIQLPTKLEQEKIANFLSDIDSKIELLENKLELLKKEKKGIMQKLLTGEIRV